jgi:hypothetical protein
LPRVEGLKFLSSSTKVAGKKHHEGLFGVLREGFSIDIRDIPRNLVFQEFSLFKDVIPVRESASGIGYQFEDRYLVILEMFPGPIISSVVGNVRSFPVS